MLNTRGAQDVRSVLTGKDGALYDDEGTMLATVESFTTQVNVSNATYQPLGDMQTHEAAQSYTVSLTFSQIIIEDDAFISEFMDALSEGTLPMWNFQGLVKGRDGSEQRMNYRSCIPTGTIDLQNLTVGDVIKRSWSFTVNEPPALQSLLTYSNS
ncbi:MAG: hypothetical protein LUE24_02985 [Lachnospiraceae bacterium]|nr:hypothetical protein [Lachnospiraceae bacterium]MCD8196124.1 hypothetical protein [Lachnospiraceae bacterium]